MINKLVNCKTFAAVLLALALCVAYGKADTTTWIASDGENWSDGANWDNGVPDAAKTAVFNGGSAAVTIDVHAATGSLVITNCTRAFTFKRAVDASLTVDGDFYLGTGATMLMTYVSTNGYGTGRVVTVSGNATIKGIIDANEQGFPAAKGPGYQDTASLPTHGGMGGNNKIAPYGSATNPTSLGSGGQDAAGGGAIRLNVGGTLNVTGEIRANPKKWVAGMWSSGAGGSIWLTAQSLTGNGKILAEGYVYANYASGGGRIALDCDTSAFTGTVSVKSYHSAAYTYEGQPGTLCAPAEFIAPTGSADNVENVLITRGCQFYPTDTNTVYYWNLTVQTEWFELHQCALHLGDITVTNGAVVRFNRPAAGFTHYLMHEVDNIGAFDLQALTVSNSMTVVGNVSRLVLPAEGSYDLAGNLLIGSGATIDVAGNTSAVNSESGGTTNKKHGCGATIRVGGGAVIQGTLTAWRRGFRAAEGPGYAGSNPGGTYGGQGGRSTATVYGAMSSPTALGSGGVDANSGGAIRLVVSGALDLSGGVISADGASAYWSGGSGGSLWLRAQSLTGNGTITADGGRLDWVSGLPGGGGRISIEYNENTFTGTVRVRSNPSATQPGRYGTITTLELPAFGGIESAYTVNGHNNGVRISRIKETAQRKELRWIESCEELTTSAQLNNTVTYTVSGLMANMEYFVKVDDALVFTGDSDGNGVLAGVQVSLTGGPRSVHVIPNLPRGAVIRCY